MNQLPPSPMPPTGGMTPTANPPQFQKKFPVGVILIIILTGLAIPGALYQLANPMIMIGAVLITGVAGFAYALMLLAVYIALFVWLIQRKEKGRILGMAVSAYQMLMSTLAFLTSVFRPEALADMYETMVPEYSDFFSPRLLSVMFGLGALLAWVVGGAVILYLYFNKRHFRP